MRVQDNKKLNSDQKRKIKKADAILELKQLDTSNYTTLSLIELSKLSKENRNQTRRTGNIMYTAQELEIEAAEYFKAVEYRNAEGLQEIPDVEGIALWLGVSRATLCLWENDVKYPEIANVVRDIKSRIMYYKKQLAYSNRCNATVFIFDAKNNHGYKDKTEIENTVISDANEIQKVANLPQNVIEEQYNRIKSVIEAEVRSKILEEMKQNSKEVEITNEDNTPPK